jgi:hypothetical protein
MNEELNVLWKEWGHKSPDQQLNVLWEEWGQKGPACIWTFIDRIYPSVELGIWICPRQSCLLEWYARRPRLC